MPVYDDFIQPTAIHIQLDLKDNDPKLAPVLTSTTTVPSGSDGKLVFAHPSLTAKAGLSAPAKDSDVRTVQGSATKLVVSGELRNSIGRGKNHVCLRFSDLHVGALLERYAPCGLEGHLIDKVTVAVINVPRSWEIRTNGKKTGLSVEWAKVRSSDIYFYVGEVVSETSFDVDGRVSVEAFSSERGVDWKRVEARTKAVVAEMTDRFGAMSHKKLLIEINRRHSMEYAGALSCRPKHLAHELTHMWFGRGACRPKNSDAGWLDEAVAEFLTQKSVKKFKRVYALAKSESEAEVSRCTSRAAYTYGASLLVWLQERKKGVVDVILSELLALRRPFTTADFLAIAEKHIGKSRGKELRDRVYGWGDEYDDLAMADDGSYQNPGTLKSATWAGRSTTGGLANSAGIAGGRGHAREFYEGPVFVKTNDTLVLIAVGYRKVVDGDAVEFWALLEDEGINLKEVGSVERLVVTPISEPAGSPEPSLAQFQAWAREKMDLAHGKDVPLDGYRHAVVDVPIPLAP